MRWIILFVVLAELVWMSDKINSRIDALEKKIEMLTKKLESKGD